MQDKNDPYLKQVPVVNEHLKYEELEEIVKLIFKNDKKIQKLFRKFGMKIPQNTTLELDTYSSFVFLQIDGQTSLYKIGQKAAKKFPDDQEKLYERLVIFFDFLKQKKWIVYK